MLSPALWFLSLSFIVATINRKRSMLPWIISEIFNYHIRLFCSSQYFSLRFEFNFKYFTFFLQSQENSVECFKRAVKIFTVDSETVRIYILPYHLLFIITFGIWHSVLLAAKDLGFSWTDCFSLLQRPE